MELQKRGKMVMSKQIQSGQFIDQASIAGMLGITRRTFRRLVVGKKFPAADLILSKTLLRWNVRTVDAWLAENAQGGRRQP